jgi:uncharacterized protein (DUF362 family)
MKDRNHKTRREFLKNAGLAVGAATVAGGGLSQVGAAETAPDLVVASGKDAKAIVRKAIEQLGGMKQFVSKGDVVVVKPNIGWDRLPRQAANTNPDVVAALVEMALEAGAKQVKVFDNSVNNARSTYARSGIKEAAEKAGAKVGIPDDRFFKKVTIGGTFLKTWPVYTEALDCDCFINVPIAKHHSVSRLTMILKNHMGIIGGERNHWHRSLDAALAEFGLFFQSDKKRKILNVLDAYRILLRHGPTGGSLRDVEMAYKCIAGVDQAAVDAYGTTLFKQKPTQFGYLVRAKQLGVGEIDLSKLKIQEVEVG